VTSTPALREVEAVLLDIEGTTTPITFVYDVLFPYARRNLQRHIEQHASSVEYAALFGRLRDEYNADADARAALPPWTDVPDASRLTSVASYCEWLMDRDRKSTALKELQGKIWEEGYARGELTGEVFEDVPRALERWRTQELQIAIFSSGSVLAQQLLFRHSSAGDLTRFIQGYFDTTTGPKAESESYGRIAAAMGHPPEAVLFISDVTSELDAARRAGMSTRLSVRPGNKAAPPAHGHPIIYGFEAVD
jgi:enolase-phosphatase E1